MIRRKGMQQEHILRPVAIFHQALGAYRTFRCILILSLSNQPCYGIRDVPIRDTGNRDADRMTYPPVACRTARRWKYSGFFEGNPESLSTPALYARSDAANAACATSGSMILLYRHIFGSNASTMLLRCDTVGIQS